MRQKIFFVLMLTWMLVIFVFSARDSVESTEDSYRVGMEVGRLVVPAFNSLSKEEQTAFAAAVDFPIRKTAHAAEYAILGVLTIGTLYDARRRNGRYISVRGSILAAWAVAAAYAVSDEIHQLFVPGRSGQLSDVLLDSAGALAGVLLGVFFMRKKKRKTEKRSFRSICPKK